MTVHRVIEAAVMTWITPERVKRLSLPNCCYSVSDFDHLEIVMTKMGCQILVAAIPFRISGRFASGNSDQPDQTGAKQPNRVGNRHRGGGGHSALQGQDKAVG